MKIVKVSIVVIFTLIVLFSGALLLRNQNQPQTTQVRAELEVTPTAIPAPILEELMVSPDGVMTVTMESQRNGDITDYAVSTTNELEGEVQSIFTKELASSHVLSIPFNTWSPDNRYFFLKESIDDKHNYYVFNTNGEYFSDASPFLDIQNIFTEQVEGYVISDVTGWAAPNLLLVNTQEVDSDQNMSFWFDVPSRSLIGLSTYFD